MLHYYLPDGLRYATLTGGLTELGVWDWRDGVDRLKATSAERDLEPLIDALPVGSRVVLVEPITWTLGRWRAPWTSLVRIRSKEWSQFLSNDPRLEVTSIQPTEFTPPRPNPVQATVMVKTRLAGQASARSRRRGSESSSSSVPPIRSASSRPIARPRPKPLSTLVALPRWKRSKMCSRSSSGTPGPRSATRTATRLPVVRRW